MKSSKDENEIVYFGPSLKNEEIDKEFNNLYKKLIEYKNSIFKLVQKICPNNDDDQIRLALNIGETDGSLLSRLVTKECEKRQLQTILTEKYVKNLKDYQINLEEFTSFHKEEFIMVKDIADMITELYETKELQPMLINKSRCSYGKIGAVLFSIVSFSVNKERRTGFAVFIPRQSGGNVGTLHILDEFGIKRKIKSNVRIVDLDNYQVTDIFYPEFGDWESVKKTIEPLIISR